MSRSDRGSGDTEFYQDLTRERRRVRQLHNTTKPADELAYRGHTLTAENPAHPDHDAYEVRDPDGNVLFTLERSDFYTADAWVRAVDAVIEHGPEQARQYLGEIELDQYVVSAAAQSSKKRHRPHPESDDDDVQPACRTAKQKDRDWALKDARQTVFYDDCERCFGGGPA